MLNREEAKQLLIKNYELYNKLENGPIDEDDAEVELREIVFSKGDIATALDVKPDRVAKLMAALEEEGAYFVRNNSGHFTITQEQATELCKLHGKKTIPQLRQEGRKYVVPVVIVNTSKGGVAKSTTAIHLAVSSALDFKRDQRVILLDGDPQGSIIKQISPLESGAKFQTLAELIKDYGHLDRQERLSPEKQAFFREYILENVLVDTYLDNLRLIPADMVDTRIESKIQSVLGDHGPERAYTIIKDIVITPLLNDADLFIIDTSPAPNLTTNNHYFASNHVQFCTTGRKQDYRSFVAHHTYLADTLEEAPSDFEGFLSIKTLITRHIDNKTKQSLAMKKNVARINSVSDVFMQPIHENAKYEEASQDKVPVQLYTSKNDDLYKNALEEIKDLYSQFIENINVHLFAE